MRLDFIDSRALRKENRRIQEPGEKYWKWPYFQKFVWILEEEESKRARDVALPTPKNERMSSLTQQYVDDGNSGFTNLFIRPSSLLIIQRGPQFEK